jgi:hypothetical protein
MASEKQTTEQNPENPNIWAFLPMMPRPLVSLEEYLEPPVFRLREGYEEDGETVRLKKILAEMEELNPDFPPTIKPEIWHWEKGTQLHFQNEYYMHPHPNSDYSYRHPPLRNLEAFPVNIVEATLTVPSGMGIDKYIPSYLKSTMRIIDSPEVLQLGSVIFCPFAEGNGTILGFDGGIQQFVVISVSWNNYSSRDIPYKYATRYLIHRSQIKLVGVLDEIFREGKKDENKALIQINVLFQNAPSIHSVMRAWLHQRASLKWWVKRFGSTSIIPWHISLRINEVNRLDWVQRAKIPSEESMYLIN